MNKKQGFKRERAMRGILQTNFISGGIVSWKILRTWHFLTLGKGPKPIEGRRTASNAASERQVCHLPGPRADKSLEPCGVARIEMNQDQESQASQVAGPVCGVYMQTTQGGGRERGPMGGSREWVRETASVWQCCSSGRWCKGNVRSCCDVYELAVMWIWIYSTFVSTTWDFMQQLLF